MQACYNPSRLHIVIAARQYAQRTGANYPIICDKLRGGEEAQTALFMIMMISGVEGGPQTTHRSVKLHDDSNASLSGVLNDLLYHLLRVDVVPVVCTLMRNQEHHHH